MLVQSGTNLEEVKKEALQKEVVVERGEELLVTEAWADKVARVLLLSDKEVPKEDRLDALAVALMEVFPKGKKEGTSVYWKGNKKDTKLKLQKFFKLYGNIYTDEQIITAAKQYVASFNGNYAYMRALKYFIWKDERKIDSDGNGYIEEVSDLATYIENAGQEETTSQDWDLTLK
ncbi:MAG: hypothetical protein U0K68_01595 [Agathobacter sp.]|nr:hypothetical protein [Agathobacter sp.]